MNSAKWTLFAIGYQCVFAYAVSLVVYQLGMLFMGQGNVIGSIAAMGPERVVYVSCDPATLGRDVKRFGELGYRAVRACAVDMFPATRHVESVVLLERS